MVEQKEKTKTQQFGTLQETHLVTVLVNPGKKKQTNKKQFFSPVLLSVGNDGEAVGVVSVAADVRVPPGHPC